MIEMENLLDEFTKVHNEFILNWDIAMASGDTSRVEIMTEDYYVAFFRGANNQPMFFNKQEAVSGMKQSVEHFLGAKKKFGNRVIRLRDNENAVVFYEQLIERNDEVLARMFTIENWQLTNGKWMIVREIEEAIN